MLFHIYLFVLFAGIGIGSVEYIRWCERSLPASADIPPEIALTFDDGPHPVYTKKLLDGLRKRGVKATFFLIGENIEGNEELVKQMAEDGHLIGNHTWSHVDVTKMSDKQACEEITKTSELVKSIVGYDTEYIVEKVMSEAKENAIILLHDRYEASVEAALRIVDLLKEQGYTFVTADKLVLE